MALNNLTRIGNSGFGTDTSINTTGIVTAASFSGDGSGLTGVTATGSGVVVQEEGSNVGTAQTINFIGSGVTATFSGGIASVEISTSGGGGGGGLSDVVSDTTPQLGGNLDLNGNNITGTGDINITGNALFSGDLNVDGHVNLDNVSIAGVTTFTGNVSFASSALFGDSDKILLGTGDDLQIYHNGTNSYIDNATGSLYIRGANGNHVRIQSPSGEDSVVAAANGSVELYYDNSKKFETTNTGATVTGTLVATATTATNVTVANEASDTECFVMFGVNATGDNAPKSSSSLKYNSSTGGLSAGSFIGDGSGLTGITASGSGVIVRDGGSLVGTAGTIDFGSNVSVSPISAGVVTVTASAGSIPGINTSGTTEVNNLTATGVITATSFNGNGASVTNVNAVSIGGTPLTDLQKKNADTDLVMFNQILHFGPANTKSRIRWSGTTSLWDLIDGDLKIRDNITDRFTFERTTGNFSASNVNVSGIITATTFSGSGASLTTLNASELDSGTIPDARFPATLPAVSGANLTNLPAPTPADTDVQATFDVSSNGSSAYRFTGPGYSGADDNPDIYLVRGQRYRFINGTGSGHPFRIQSDISGTAYTDGVSGSQSGTQDFNVQHDAPARLYYQCTIHSGMIGNIYIVGGSDWRMTDVATNATPEIFTNLNVGIGTDNPNAKLEVRDGKIRAGDVPATQGATILEGRYSGGDVLNIFGSHYSSGATVLSYGMRPKNGASGYVSSFDNSSGARTALEMWGDGAQIVTAPAQQTPVGSDLTSVTGAVKVNINGDVTMRGTDSQYIEMASFRTTNGATLVSNNGGFLSFTPIENTNSSVIVHSISTNPTRITFPVAGIVYITFHQDIRSGNATNSSHYDYIRFKRNGSNYLNSLITSTSSLWSNIHGTATIEVSNNDYIELELLTNTSIVSWDDIAWSSYNFMFAPINTAR